MSPRTSELTQALRDRWMAGVPADARALSEQHPELADHPSAMVDLAYEEFCLRRSGGEAIDLEEFCGRFPGCRTALRQMLLVDDLIGQNPGLIDDVPLPPENYPEAGEEVCGCVLLRVLGRGAFSTVYLAREVEAGNRPVVLKLSRLNTGEGRVLGPLAHENVVPLHWPRLDRETGWNVLCMPFLGTVTLTHVIDRLYPIAGRRPPASGQAILQAVESAARPDDPLPARPATGASLAGLSLPRAAARLGCELASALAHVHQLGQAHGDVKPANVLLQSGGQPLLLDFNLSRAGDLGRVGGTFPYMSPEHLRAFRERQPLTAGQAAASDVYALGVMLYELLTGELPHGGPRGDNAQQCADAMLERLKTPPRPVRRLNPRVPARLERLIGRCLSADHAARPSAAELAAALAEPSRRRRRLLAGVLALLFAVVLGLGGGLFVRAGSALSESELRQRGRERLDEGRRRQAEGDAEGAQAKLHEAAAAYSEAIDRHKRAGARLGASGDYFDRGRAQLGLKDYGEAQSCFSQAIQAYRLENGPQQDGTMLAYAAYACALVPNHEEAVRQGHVALPLNQRSAAVPNNLAYSMMQKGGRGKFPEAQRLLDQAIARDPNCLAAYYNRARLEFRRVLGDPEEEVTAQALADVDRAIWLCQQRGSESRLVYLLGAQLSGRAAQDAENDFDLVRAEELRQQARAYAIRACALGTGRAALMRDPMLAGVVDRNLLEGVEQIRGADGPWLSLVEPESDR